MHDQELREQFDQWAAPLRATPPPACTVIRRRARRRIARLAAATCTALAVAGLAIGVAVTGAGLPATPAPTRPGTSYWGNAKYPAPPGQPYVVVNASASGLAELRDMATGAVVQVLHPLGHGREFTAMAAAPSDRLFVLAQVDGQGNLSFDELRVGTPGVPARLTPILPGLLLPDVQIYDMAVNSAGTRLVFNMVPSGGGPGRLMAYNLTYGVFMGNWPGMVTLQYWPARDQLAIDWWDPAAIAYSGLRILNLSQDQGFPAGSSLSADTRPDGTRPGYSQGALTADGSVVTSVVATVTQAGSAVQLQEFSAASGTLLWTIPVGSARAQQQSAAFCGVLWVSADGSHLLTQCGSRQQEVVNGRVTRTRLAWSLLTQFDGSVTPFAW